MTTLSDPKSSSQVIENCKIFFCVRAKASTGKVITYSTIRKNWSGIWDQSFLVSVFLQQRLYNVFVLCYSVLSLFLYLKYSIICTVSFLWLKGILLLQCQMEGKKIRMDKIIKRCWFVSSFTPSLGNSSYKEIPQNLISHINMYTFPFLQLQSDRSIWMINFQPSVLWVEEHIEDHTYICWNIMYQMVSKVFLICHNSPLR